MLGYGIIALQRLVVMKKHMARYCGHEHYACVERNKNGRHIPKDNLYEEIKKQKKTTFTA